MRYSNIFIILCASIISLGASAKDLKFVDGHVLTLVNKAIDTPRRYARVDTVKYQGFTNFQRCELVQNSAGLALAFKTNSSEIHVHPVFIKIKSTYNQNPINTEGFDLYIKKDGHWLWAGNRAVKHNSKSGKLVENMAPGEKECLLYLPNFSIVDSVFIGVDFEAYVKPIPNPFRHKIVFHGSSFTHGTCSPRPAMSYPIQFERITGIQACNMGMSGNAKLQQSYALVLADTEADAFVFDTFSNPTTEEIVERFDDFVATIRAKHPTTPLIFMQTIYCEYRNFNVEEDSKETIKMKMAEKIVREAMKKDPNMYWIVPSLGNSHETTVDGIHPGGDGYTLWMESIRQPLLDILAKYNIR